VSPFGPRIGELPKHFFVAGDNPIQKQQRIETGFLRCASVTNPFQYTGRDLDSETSLLYYRARYYDPTVGRFISEDPIKFKGGIDFYP
jgi:RHS repeat-associated protein